MICDNCIYKQYAVDYDYCRKGYWEGEALDGFINEDCNDFYDNNKLSNKTVIFEHAAIFTRGLIKNK